MSNVTVEQESAFTALDRCDRCGAQAFVRTELPTGMELLWCGHHWVDHQFKIEQIPGVKVTDESNRIR